MPSEITKSTIRIANQFIDYLHSDEYFQNKAHIKKISPLVGMLVWKIGNLANEDIWQSNTRQLKFTYRNRIFKARFQHKIEVNGTLEKGVIQIVETVGKRDGNVAHIIAGFEDIEELQEKLDAFIDG